MPPLIHTALVQEVISSRYCQAREESKNAYLIFRPCRWQKPVTIVIQACDGCILSYTKPSSSTSCHEFTNLSFRVPVICPESAVSATLNLKFNPEVAQIP
ncbi:uncharacterized protein LOC106436416 isoform X2 [Brassica napus]|uniref:uncharacterized protein LOC106293726 isoform X2 n=1 Tax=Brassica oleracea var. oleracea TaxID=109376 RepID=UPI0006A71C3F|nr:PREDICTED: uncharacterized protein LOC106293726 isoform X2 [Brassica oleracea var. oleracea]XP_048610283.1 uncharacterized protein LOC106436416 isoform X2 [Brassica napus]